MDQANECSNCCVKRNDNIPSLHFFHHRKGHIQLLFCHIGLLHNHLITCLGKYFFCVFRKNSVENDTEDSPDQSCNGANPDTNREAFSERNVAAVLLFEIVASNVNEQEWQNQVAEDSINPFVSSIGYGVTSHHIDRKST